jgi:uncharacterized lipoprotein YddW (UPF0748 family)
VEEQGDFTLTDPLKLMIREAEQRGLAVYAVVNPYYLGDQTVQLARSHPAAKQPDLVLEAGGSLYLNPPTSAR